MRCATTKRVSSIGREYQVMWEEGAQLEEVVRLEQSAHPPATVTGRLASWVALILAGSSMVTHACGYPTQNSSVLYHQLFCCLITTNPNTLDQPQ